uniref:Uncharacterized protein n=1 Tax=Trichuris muris TaxID=70415 RepID=A0A5S6R2F0_TRIMR
MGIALGSSRVIRQYEMVEYDHALTASVASPCHQVLPVQMGKQRCQKDCDNCVRIDATESVLKLCADMDTETCLRLLDENVEDNMATRYLTMCLRMRKNKNASH